MVSFVQQPIAGGPGCWDSQWQGATCRWRWSWSFEITQNKTKLNTTDFWPSLLKILSSSVFQSMHYVFSSYQNLHFRIDKNGHLSFHFLHMLLIQSKIFGHFINFSFTFDQYLGMRWLPSGIVKFTIELVVELVRLWIKCWDQWNLPLQNLPQIFLGWSCLWKYLEDIFLKKGCPHKKSNLF